MAARTHLVGLPFLGSTSSSDSGIEMCMVRRRQPGRAVRESGEGAPVSDHLYDMATNLPAPLTSPVKIVSSEGTATARCTRWLRIPSSATARCHVTPQRRGAMRHCPRFGLSLPSDPGSPRSARHGQLHERSRGHAVRS